MMSRITKLILVLVLAAGSSWAQRSNELPPTNERSFLEGINSATPAGIVGEIGSAPTKSATDILFTDIKWHEPTLPYHDALKKGTAIGLSQFLRPVQMAFGENGFVARWIVPTGSATIDLVPVNTKDFDEVYLQWRRWDRPQPHSSSVAVQATPAITGATGENSSTFLQLTGSGKPWITNVTDFRPLRSKWLDQTANGLKNQSIAAFAGAVPPAPYTSIGNATAEIFSYITNVTDSWYFLGLGCWDVKGISYVQPRFRSDGITGSTFEIELSGFRQDTR